MDERMEILSCVEEREAWSRTIGAGLTITGKERIGVAERDEPPLRRYPHAILFPRNGRLSLPNVACNWHNTAANRR